MTEPLPPAPTARELAETSMPRMLGAARAQRQQLQTLGPGVGGPSSMSVTRQIEGLQQVETLLPALVLYARQLEGAVQALGHLSVTGTDGAAFREGLAELVAEVHAARQDPPLGRLLELVLALQTQGAPPVSVAVPTAPTYSVINISIGTQQQAWRDGYTAGYQKAWADALAVIKARL